MKHPRENRYYCQPRKRKSYALPIFDGYEIETIRCKTPVSGANLQKNELCLFKDILRDISTRVANEGNLICYLNRSADDVKYFLYM